MDKQIINFWDDKIDNSIQEFQNAFESTGLFECVGHKTFSNARINNKDKATLLFNFVDIHHGFGKEKKGLEIIKTLREKNENAYIIGYSTLATKAIKEESFVSGADDFFEKTTDEEKWEEILRDKTKALVEKTIENALAYQVKKRYEGIVLDDKKNYLIRFYGENEFQSRVPFEDFSHIEKLIEINDRVEMLIGRDAQNRTIIEYKYLEEKDVETLTFFANIENSNIFKKSAKNDK